MIPQQPILQTGWRARLALEYAPRGGKTILSAREHEGPLVVQRPLYPEGPAICHTILVHPPGGIAGGDTLEVTVAARAGSRVLLTSPGAAKWYRSSGATAAQRVELAVEDGAVLEWLPQANIVFNGARARLASRVLLHEGGLFLGWEILCFGRAASGERFGAGFLKQSMEVFQQGRRLWSEFAHLEGGGAVLDSAAGLAGRTVIGTLVAAGRDPSRELLSRCREVAVPEGTVNGITALPRVLLARTLSDSNEDARAYLAAVWSVLRPGLTGVDAVMPRIWST